MRMLDFKNCCMGTREIVRAIKWLATRLENLSSILSIHVFKKKGRGVDVCNPSAGVVETSGWLEITGLPA